MIFKYIQGIYHWFSTPFSHRQRTQDSKLEREILFYRRLSEQAKASGHHGTVHRPIKLGYRELVAMHTERVNKANQYI